jgi:hypothetical protein
MTPSMAHVCYLTCGNQPSHTKNKMTMVAQRKSKQQHHSPILFILFKYLKGKKKNYPKTKLIKALVDSGVSKSILV